MTGERVFWIALELSTIGALVWLCAWVAVESGAL